MKISKHFTFEASHILPKHPGKCSRLHGHSWNMDVTVEGSIDPETGFVVDYGALKALVDREVIRHLDHSHLGQGAALTGAPEDLAASTFEPYFGRDFYPSSENLCRAIFKLLNPLVKELAHNVRLVEVKIRETCTSEARWTDTDERRGW